MIMMQQGSMCNYRLHDSSTNDSNRYIKDRLAEQKNISKVESQLRKHVQMSGSNEPRHEITNNVVCATSKASDQPAHTRSLIRAFASRLHIL